METIKSSRLRPGNIIYLEKNDLVPIDGIVIGKYKCSQSRSINPL